MSAAHDRERLDRLGIIKGDRLRDILEYERDGDIRKCLERDGIPYFESKGGGVWTTLDLINAAGRRKMGLDCPANDTEYL